MEAKTRLSLVEYGAAVDLCGQIADLGRIDRATSAQLLTSAGARVATNLRMSENPIVVEPGGVRALAFAGLIRLSPSIELEVIPKFLGAGDQAATWREDFLYLSTLSRHGRLLPTERLAATGGAARDLATLVARSLTGMYDARKRRPLRTYRRVREFDFFLDDDPDPVDMKFPSPDGYEQSTIQFDRKNAWNGAMRMAAQELIAEVSDPDASAALTRMISDLSPQPWTGAIGRKSVPSRHRAWKPAHDLSLDILNGLGQC